MNEFNKLTRDQKLWLCEQLASGEGITESGELTDPDGPRGWDRFYLEDEDGTIYEGMYYWDSEEYAELTVTRMEDED